MKRILATALALVCATALADTPYPVDGAMQKTNRAKVETFRKDAYWKDAPFAVCTVDPLSGIRRTPDLFPVDGDFTGPCRLMAAKGEYEDGSFLLFGFDDIAAATLVPGDLVAKNGARIHASEIRAKVLKVWYQQGTAWGSYESDATRRMPTPELLLNDETLVDVNHETKENFLRCDYGGATAYQLVSAIGAFVDHTGVSEPKPEWIHDAASLKPFAIQKNAFKQIIFTCHVPAGAQPGLYKGAVTVSAAGKSVRIPVELKVLPFELPLPATFRDLSRPFLLSAYLYVSLADNPKIAKNLAAHNMRNVRVSEVNRPSEAERLYKVLAEAGMDTNVLFHAVPGSGVTTSYPVKETDREYAKYVNTAYAVSNSLAALRGRFGEGVTAYSYAIDEGGPATVRAQRATWQATQKQGGYVYATTGYHKYLLFGLDFANIPRQPKDHSKVNADLLHDANPDMRLGWYGDPHSGPENPDYTRRIYGWQTWRRNYDASNQYILFRNNWNDFWVHQESFLRGLMLVYSQDHDIIDTIEWEGLREALDDIRYGTLLKQLAEKARHSKNIDTAYAGRAASTWIAQVDYERSALDYLRLEMVSRILDLRERLVKEDR